ncbi:MAG: ribonuclease HI family protein [bacterium]|nr:ribonuclease HI family protein [bacterium]MDZ4296590.1 ribonuclease HI family protein [Patescibacteria group bacterium]
MQHETFIINTDGGARGNPGPAAAGVVIRSAQGDELAAFGEYLGHSTNNDAEYRALILALKKLKALIGGRRAKSALVEVRMDSELIVRQVNGVYKINEEHLKPLFVDVWNLRIDFGKVTFVHVPREQNRDADRMVNAALDNASEG